MQKRIIEIAVGVFVLLGILALLVLAIKVSGLHDIYEGNGGYKIAAEFINVGGLKPRAKVTMAGVAVGRVVSITFDRETYNAEVSMLIDKAYDNIPEDSDFSIKTAGLLGDNYISINPGMSMDQFLREGDHIDVANTSQAIVLEDIISKFFSSQASGLKMDESKDEDIEKEDKEKEDKEDKEKEDEEQKTNVQPTPSQEDKASPVESGKE